MTQHRDKRKGPRLSKKVTGRSETGQRKIKNYSQLATTKERIAADERAAQCLELRKTGMSLRAIAAQLGMSSSGVEGAIKRELEAITREPAEELKALELERMDVLLKGLWPAALKGDTYSVDSALKVMARRARLLGLDAPTKTANEHTGADKGPIAVTTLSREQLLAELREELEDNPEFRKSLVGA